MKRRRMKRMVSVFLAFVLCFSLLATNVGNGAQVVNAETQSDNSTSEESSQNAIDEETADAVAEELGLVKDAESSGVYYNSSSNMTDFRDETIYFVMTTRFYDGDSSNNVQCWDAQDKNVNDPPWRGDFKGLIEKLDYIKALGFTAVWITPVVKNASGYDYHGYHAINFKEVDPRYESDGCDYQDLIDAIHARGMKVIQDVVFQHTGNWGEENLYPMFKKDDNADLSDVSSCMIRNMDMDWASDYETYTPEEKRGEYQLRDRLKLMNADSDEDTKYDINDIYHHNGFVGSSFEQPIVQYGSIAYADCIDLNTENPTVYKYLVDAYSQYIRMGVDAFRVDTVKHISRLTLNNAFNQQLNDVYNEVHGTTGEGNFFMFGEVCTRWRGVWNSNNPSISTPFYTWKETKEYAWDDSETAAAVETNCASARQHYKDNESNTGEQLTSKNAYLNGNSYHTPDYSQASGMNVIDFPMHWAFKSASDAYSQALQEDPYYNDATFNVTYVDSHDYAPDKAPENKRYDQPTETWAENLSLIFTFRGIPCIYYGSEVEFQKGMEIDVGIGKALAETGRAYFGDYIEGSVDVVDFGRYTNATGAMAETLNNPLSLHIQRLNRLRAAIPALRKGQYSTEGCSGSFAYKRRYTDDTTDSFALIALTSDATFTGIPGGTYVDAITGDTKTVAEGGTLSTSGIKGQGDLRVYVLNTDKTPAPGMIDGYSKFMSGGKDLEINVKEPTGITLNKTSASISCGDSVELTATIAPSDATNKTVTWKSSNPSVATVSNGKVTGKGEGTATITATTSNGLTAEATIEVKVVNPTGVTLDKTSASLDLGDTVTFTATVSPEDASFKDVTWTSSDPSVATVSAGKVTAKEEGTTTITASTSNGIKATATVTVKATGVKVESVTLSKQSVSLEIGETAQVNATIEPSDASPKYAKLTWTSSDPSVVTVSSEGLITGVKAGNATITATTASGISATMKVEVTGVVIYGNAIYFEKPANWGNNINVYFWTDGATWENKEWPGVAMTAIDESNGIYGIEWPEGKESVSLNVIFNDGTNGNKTDDLEAKINGYYNSSGYVKDVPVTEKPIAIDISFADSSTEYIYDGKEKKPEVIVKSGDTTLQKGTDYEVSYLNNINAGLNTAGTKAPTVVITGKGSYENRITSDNTMTFTISPRTLTDENVDITGTYTYSGKEIEPTLQVSDTAATITEKDYELSYSNNINAGTATVTVKGIGNYTGTVTKQFEIARAEKPNNVPTDMVVSANSKLSDIELNGGWGWQEADKDIVIKAGETKDVMVVYNGTDKANYKTVSVTIKVTGTSCQHEDTSKREIKGEVEVTCTEDGYSGDTYCTDCGAIVSKGDVIAKTGHDWDTGEVTKEPTATEKGIKTYTCTVCQEEKTEDIPIRVTTEDPTTEKPTTEKLTTEKPTTEKPTTEKKTTGKPTTEKATTEKPTTEKPSSGTTETVTEVTQKVVSVKTDKKNLKKGNLVKDPVTKATFRVTNAKVITKTVEYVLPNSKAKKIVIPDKVLVNGVTYKVTSVADSAFKDNETVEEVSLGKNVKSLGKNAFNGCKNLKEVELSQTVTQIGDKAFYKCTKLKKITIPSKVSKIGKQAFYGCKNLKTITIKTTKLTSKKVGSKAFKNISSKATIKVPKSKLKAYKKLLREKGISSKATIKK